MKKTSAKITRFESGKWYVDIIETRTMFEAWLSRKDCGVSDLMFCSAKKQMDSDGNEWEEDSDFFCEMVEVNLPEYKAIYELEH